MSVLTKLLKRLLCFTTLDDMRTTCKATSINLEKSYDYICKVFNTNGVLPVDALYGDGSIHNNDYVGFCKLYTEMLKELS